MKRPPIRVLDVAGSPEKMGQTHGFFHGPEIRSYAQERLELVTQGAWSGGPLPAEEVLSIANSMIDAHARFDPDLHAEMMALAEAAELSPAEAIIVGGFTDFVDTVRAVTGGPTPNTLIEDDCTAVIVPNQLADGQGFLAQTWDMHDTATDHVLLLRVRPENAPAALVFTTTGCLGQIGMNEAGVCVGINNLTGSDGARGVTWPSVVRSMLKTENADDALEVLLKADLAGAHNYLIFDAQGAGYMVEAMPSIRPVTSLGSESLVHTNHTLGSETSAVQVARAPQLDESSQNRLAKARELLSTTAQDRTITVADLMALTREPSAICQVPVDPYRVESSGATVMRPGTGEFWACWGQPAENAYQKIAFPEAPSARTRTRTTENPETVDGEAVIAVGASSGLRYAHIVPSWATRLEELELASYPTADPADLYNRTRLRALAEDFGQGCFAGFDGDRLVAMGLGLRTFFNLTDPQHTIDDIVPEDYGDSGHEPEGRWYYGTGISVHPDYRRRGIGAELYDLRKAVCTELNLRGIVAGGVMPGYAPHTESLTADDYIAKVVTGELYDPTLTFQQESGFALGPALKGYITDPAVNDYAALIIWRNPDWQPSQTSMTLIGN